MSENTTSLEQQRARLLQQMGQIPLLIRGKLSVQTFQAKGRTQGPYYLLQRWEDRKNQCQRIPPDQLDWIRHGLAGFARFEQLADQYVRLSEKQTWEAQAPEVKKKFQKFWSPASPTPAPSSNRPKPS
jgi:hypothetical protein